MKTILLIFLLFAIHFSLLAQQDSGFTNKAEAKNLMVNGLKEGKWVQYYKVKDRSVSETKSKDAPFYRFTIYSAGKAIGTVREYFKDGKLWCETPYVNGNINGIKKMYDENGTLVLTDTVLHGKENGMIKVFYPSGKIKMEFPFVNDSTNIQEVINFEPQGAIHTYQDKEPTIPYGIRGLANGVLKMYYEDGKLKFEVSYVKGKGGKSTNYDESGKEIK
jgi:antitoxin component YwqK of YwqJK toxin-antitoxin module